MFLRFQRVLGASTHFNIFSPYTTNSTFTKHETCSSPLFGVFDRCGLRTTRHDHVNPNTSTFIVQKANCAEAGFCIHSFWRRVEPPKSWRRSCLIFRVMLRIVKKQNAHWCSIVHVDLCKSLTSGIQEHYMLNSHSKKVTFLRPSLLENVIVVRWLSSAKNERIGPGLRPVALAADVANHFGKRRLFIIIIHPNRNLCWLFFFLAGGVGFVFEILWAKRGSCASWLHV